MSLITSTGTFRHGVHPTENKGQTEHLRLERMPFVARYTLPLRQHLGAPCVPEIKIGERVQRGQVIGTPGGFVSTTLHSPVAGRVIGISPQRYPSGALVESIEIEADPYSMQQFEDRSPIDWQELELDEFVEHVQRAGLVGLGGAAFPSHVKYKLPEGKRCENLVINGCECEPYLTGDHRLMVERPEAIVRGITILSTKLGVDTTTNTAGATRLADLLTAFDQMNVDTDDQIAIIYELEKTGILHAEIVHE